MAYFVFNPQTNSLDTSDNPTPIRKNLGQKLLAKVKELGEISKLDLINECGYGSQRENENESQTIFITLSGCSDFKLLMDSLVLV